MQQYATQLNEMRGQAIYATYQIRFFNTIDSNILETTLKKDWLDYGRELRQKEIDEEKRRIEEEKRKAELKRIE